ncbi:MAG: TRAP transporter small permease [Spirochaetota bacterium]
MKKLYRLLCRFEKIACGVGFLFLVAFVFFAAVLRFFNISLSWSIDLAMLLLAWTAFTGADVAWREGQIIGVDVLTKQFPPKVQHIIQIAIYLVIVAALVIMVVFGARLAWSERARTYQSMRIPYSLVTISVVVAASSMILSTILKIRNAVLLLAEKSPESE